METVLPEMPGAMQAPGSPCLGRVAWGPGAGLWATPKMGALQKVKSTQIRVSVSGGDLTVNPGLASPLPLDLHCYGSLRMLLPI